MERKSLASVELKDADQGIVSAVFSRFDTVDHDNDVTLRTAFTDGAPVQISSFNHGSWEGSLPVGKGVIRVTDGEAVLDGQFFMKTQHGRETFQTIKELGELGEWSFGFHITDSEPGEFEGKSVRVIKAVDVTEVSPVLKGAGVGTRTLALKRQFTQEQRDQLADDGKAMPDGSFPIENEEDLKNAIQAIGRADNPDAVKRHIVRRARALEREDLIPEEWRKMGHQGEWKASDDSEMPTIEDKDDLKKAISAAGKNPSDALKRHIMSRARALDAEDTIPDGWRKDKEDSEDDGGDGKRRAVRGAIPCHDTGILKRAWDGARVVKGLPGDARPSELRSVYAWVDPDGDPEVKSSYQYAHHHGIDGPANIRACLQQIAKLNSDEPGIPERDREAVYKHLSAHLLDADREPPGLRTADGETGRKRFNDEAVDVMAAVSNLIDRASEVVVLRAKKGRGMSPATADLLSWLGDDLKRLHSLLETPVDEDKPEEPGDDQLSSLYLQALARINEL